MGAQQEVRVVVEEIDILEGLRQLKRGVHGRVTTVKKAGGGEHRLLVLKREPRKQPSLE